MPPRWHPYFYKRVGRPLVVRHSNVYNQTKSLYVILSLSNFCGANSDAEARAIRRSGISQRLSVACQREVTFSVESHQNLFGDPCVAYAP